MGNYIYKHGLPGIGVTGKQGKQGKSGNSIYFGTFNSFFSYIDTSLLLNSSIDYDDKDYDITYTKDEYRLDPKYNVGDLLYIISSSTAKDSSIECVIEVTDELTTCTSTQLKEHISYLHPFTVNKNNFSKLNIVGTGASSKAKQGMFITNELYNDYPINITYITNNINSKPEKVGDLSEPNISVADESYCIPVRYLGNKTIYNYINNGKEINKYKTPYSYTKTILSCKNNTRSLNIESTLNSNIAIQSLQNLYIDNLYIRNNNKGNVEALNTLYNKDLKLNSFGNCYTLTEDNYDTSTQSFIMNIDEFFNETSDVSKGDYIYGYIHMYYNYNDMNNPSSGVRACYYSNYIKGTFTDDVLSKIKVPQIDNNGNYIRNYNDSSYKQVKSIDLKQVLINTWNTSTLNDVSMNIPESVNNEIFNLYKNYKGIILTEDVEQYKIYDKVKDVCTGYSYRKYKNDGTIIIYNREGGKPDAVNFNDYFDTSYYSGIESKQINYADTSIMKISLDKSDNDSQKYRHHMIYQYVGNKYGIKYFSKLTRADFNYQTSEFDIDSSFAQVNIKDLNKALKYDDVFDITIDNRTMYLEFKDKLTEIYNLKVYQNNIAIEDQYIKYNNFGIYQISNILESTQNILTDVINKIPNDNFLKLLYNSSVINIPNTEVLYTIKYNTVEDDVDENNKEVFTNTVTYNRVINGYSEKRTIPEIKMNIINDFESLENINNSSNGILCNQFQTFMSIEIDKFSTDDWGLYTDYLKDPILRIYVNRNVISGTKLTADDTIKDWIFKYTLYKPGIDIYNMSSKEFDNNDIIKELQTSTEDGKTVNYYEFNIDEAMLGIWYLRIYMESENPEPYTFNLMYTIDKIKIITSNNYTFTLNAKDINKDTLYKSNIFKLSIAPISYIASYAQNMSPIQSRYLQRSFGIRKWFGSRDITNIAIMPYRYDEISQKKVISNKQNKENNWNSIAFKNRYLQDNIKNLSIYTQNINNMYNLLPDKLYSIIWLCEDQDDISENYLRFVFNSNLFTPKLINDQYSFIFNNERILASQYSQLSNNSAIYVHQYNDIPLRSESLLKSMMKWNDEYEKNYHYETDNPYKGHFETYGNGYQYLPSNADNGQYSTCLSLSEIKTQNELQFFDLGKNKVKTYQVNKPDKKDSYTPSILFNQLLYQLSWCYPYYTTKKDDSENNINNKQYIKQMDFDNAITLENGVIDINKMPYNLCYNLYPRMMFNDEEQYNVVLMLRKPSVKKEGQYEFTKNDIQQRFNISTIQTINRYLYSLN